MNARFQHAGSTYAVVELARVVRPDLTPAERAIAAALLEGRSAAAIARSRGTARKTVEHQIAALFAKLGCGRRADLVVTLARCQRPTKYP